MGSQLQSGVWLAVGRRLGRASARKRKGKEGMGSDEGDSEVDWFGEELELRERVECSGTPRSPQFPFLTAFLSFRGLHMKPIATRLFSPSAWLAGFLDLHYGNGPIRGSC
jgi:hypothetical protein